MSYETLHHRSVRLAAKERMPKPEREKCLRCGRNVPKRHANTGFCTVKCYEAQQRANAESDALERALQEDGYVSGWHSSDPSTDHG